MYLLDTTIILELRKAKAGAADRGLTLWAAKTAPQFLFISALSLLEIEASLAALEGRDKVAAQALRTWVDDQLMPAFDARILAIDAAVAKRRRSVSINDPRDALLASVALTHGLTLVTRTQAHYKTAKLKTLNPSEFAPTPENDLDDWREPTKTGSLWLKNLFIRS